MADTAKWFLKFDTAGGGGRPWGDGTAMAARAAQGVDPWDTPCEVTPVVGGFAAMTAIREAFKQAITDAKASTQAEGQRGHVYISGWRLNAQRDLSANVRAWTKPYPDVPEDETALGLLFRLMQAGVRIRVMVWLPTAVQTPGAGHAHIEDHYFSARAIAAESARLDAQWNLTDPIGIMALDARTAEGSIAGSHHQKAIVIRGLAGRDVAFCGGVDLAFTRRDAPASAGGGLAGTPGPGYNDGDWQSGTGIPPWPDPDDPSDIPWPRDSGTTVYTSFLGLDTPTHVQESDLPAAEDGTGLPIYGATNHLWHDQHLILKGPIVRTLEDQFAERWNDSADLYDLSSPGNTFGGQVIFSSAKAISGGDIVALPLSQPAAAAPAGSTAAVQMWRTIPWRDARTRPPFQRAEFTVMSGVSHAVAQAEHLIWIFDQYFWSVQLGRQLNAQLKRADRPDLRVIVILPPFADSNPAIIHEARRRALAELTKDVAGKVGVYNLWASTGLRGPGVYVHAKVQTYDGGLLVCGSANMNRRSFLCDSEIACAVADEPTVAAQQQALWNMLFHAVPGTLGQWPAPNFTAAGSGQQFFTAFTSAAANGNAGLKLDPWASASPRLFNQVVLPRGSPLAGPAIGHLFDPTSVDPRPLERDVDFRDAQGQLQSRPARLDDVVARIEKTVSKGGGKRMPNRRQSSELRDIFSEPTDFQDFAL